MKKWILLAVLIIVLMIPVGLLGLMNTASGSRWLLRMVFSSLAQQASVAGIDGRLLERIELSGLRYQNDAAIVTLNKLVFAWQPAKLFSGTLKIVDMSLADVNVSMTGAASPPQEKSSFDLAAFRLPLAIIIENLWVTNFVFQQGEQSQRLEKLHITVLTDAARRLVIRGDWHKLNGAQIGSEQGDYELTGWLDAYRIAVNGDLIQPTLPKAQLVFNGKGDLNSLFIEKLELGSTAGMFQAAGHIAWKDAPVFDLTASGQDFNPAILSPELPGKLTFAIGLKGQLADKTLQLNADIDKFSGQLRGYPVSANGKLALAGEQLTADALGIVSGANKITVNGTLGPAQSALDLIIDAPALEALWPNLGGSLKGSGQLRGAWNNPSATFKANGKRLHFAEHSVEQLALDIDYQADAQKTSKLQLFASAIKTGAMQITKLLINGVGTPAQHRFNATVLASGGNFSSALEGRYKTGTWQGDFSKLDLKSQDFGHWQLTNTMTLRAVKSPDGMNITLDKACLVQHPGSLCAQGNYLANGDFGFQVQAEALPTNLMQAYLPPDIKLHGIINADADIGQKKGVLNGDYRLDMPANAKLLLPTQHGSTELVLGASSLAGTLKGTQVLVDFDLALVGQDYARGKLQLDTGKTQALAGRITASVLNLAPVRAFVPQLSEIKGHLTADMEMQGVLKKPVIQGTLTLEQGAVDLAESGFGVHAVNLHATASGGAGGNRIRLQGSALPVALNKPDAPQQLQITSLVTLNADVQQQAGGLIGNYRLDIPAGSSIAINTGNAASKISLGASSLSGRLNGTLISADLDLALAARDFVRAQLQLDTGETQALSGQLTASMVEFGLLNPFVPQLSNIKGQLKADLNLAGKTSEPLVDGALQFGNGAVDMNELGLELRDIKFQALAGATQAGRLRLAGSVKSGQGLLTLDGFVDTQAAAAEINLRGTDVEAAKLPEAQVAVSPELKVVYADGQGKVTGQVKIPKAFLQLKDIPENAVKVSSDEVILGEQKTGQDTAVAVNIDADVDVELGKQVRFSGQGLKTGLSGKLKISKMGEKLAVYGQINMEKARYKSYGQDLTVRKGTFLFNGPPDKPWVNLEAVRVSKDKTVTAILGLNGPADAPQTHISAEPALPESEALAYLITGGPLSQVSKSDGNRVASAALAYGASQASWIADKLGISELAVEEGKTLQDTLVAAGQYLTPDFYVGTKVGLFNKQAVLVLKRKLGHGLNVETQTGTSQRIKLNYERDAN